MNRSIAVGVAFVILTTACAPVATSQRPRPAAIISPGPESTATTSPAASPKAQPTSAPNADPSAAPSEATPATGTPAPTAPPIEGGRAAGRWTTAASMREARSGFDAVVLGDGTVLAVGSDLWCAPGGAVEGSERTEIYDPGADAWHETGSLNKPRKTFATVVTASGEAMVIGGLNADELPFSSTKQYASASATWADGPLLLEALSAPRAARTGKGGVLAVGYTEDGTSVQVLDRRAEAWRRGPPLPRDLDIRTLTALTNGRVLLTGYQPTEGTDDGEMAGIEGYAALFDPTADEWINVRAQDDSPAAVVALPGGDALAIAGYGEESGASADVQRLNGDTGRWRRAAPMPVSRYRPQVATMADGRVLVAGGVSAHDADPLGMVFTRADIYDPASDRWGRTADLLEPREDGTAIPLPDGTVLVLGGSADQDYEEETPSCPDPLVTTERFDPTP